MINLFKDLKNADKWLWYWTGAWSFVFFRPCNYIVHIAKNDGPFVPTMCKHRWLSIGPFHCWVYMKDHYRNN